MNSVFENIIEKFEEQKKGNPFVYGKNDKSRDASVSRHTLDYAIEIVKQEAKQYNNAIIDGKYCFQTCACTEKCDKCSRLCNGDIDWYENIDNWTEKYNSGWIPCSERFPEKEADVLLSLRSLDVYTGFMANTEGYFYVEGEGYVKLENVLAWQPLTTPYQPKGE